MTKILVVDDEPQMISMLKRILSREGFELDGAKNKKQALTKMRREQHPIVLLDIKFPEANGADILRSVKEINPLANVIMMTGYSSIENVMECLGEGAVDFFSKPLDMETFVESINRVDEKIERWQREFGMP